MPFSLVFNSNLIPLLGLIFLLFFACINPLFEKRQTRLFIVAIVVNLVLLVAISADYIFAQLDYETMWAWRRVTSFLNFAASPVIPFLLFNIFQQKKVRKAYCIPLILNAAVCFVSMFVNIVFFISTNNTYSRGPLFFMPFLMAVIYIVILIMKPAARQAQSKRFERIFLLCIIALLIGCMILEIAAGLHFLSWDGSALSLFLYYLLLTMFSFTVDPMTGAYNRLMYSRSLARLKPNTHYFVSVLDINDFKLVNDVHGHDVGDAFLIRFTEIIDRNLPAGSTLYRIGGDEFALISKLSDSALLYAAINMARTEAFKNDIYFACGTAEYSVGDDLAAALRLADERMYQNKNEMKAASE